MRFAVLRLVYYWFQQRGRFITNEYSVKGYLVWDAITKNRTDGSLVRLTVHLQDGEDWVDGDSRLQGFMHELLPLLPDYVPG